MSDFDGNFMDTTSHCDLPASPSPRAILAMMDQTDNGLNPITDEIFPQSNSSRDRTDQPEQRSISERLAERTKFILPPLETKMTSPFAAFFRNSSVPSSPVIVISPGFSPSALLHSPNMFYSNSQAIPPPPATSYGRPEMMETSGEAGHVTTMIFNNDLSHQPLHVDLPPQEGSNDIPMEESVYIPSQPIGAPFEFDVDDEDDILNMISLDDLSGSEDENKGLEDDEDDDEYENEDEDNDIFDDVDELDEEPSPPRRRRRYEVSNMIGATRTSKAQRVILQMESEEEHPEDGFRWRKYGQKVVKGNSNPRSYFKCTWSGCNVKKHVERGADDVKLVVTTYDGIHNHPSPPARGRGSRSKNRSGSSMSEDHNDQTRRVGRPPLSFTPHEMSSSFSSFTSFEMRPPSSSYTPHEMMPPSSYTPHEMMPPPLSYTPQGMRPPPSSYTPHEMMFPPLSYTPHEMMLPPSSYTPHEMMPPPSSYTPHEMRPPLSYTPHEMMPPSLSYIPHEMMPPSSYTPHEIRPPSSSYTPHEMMPSPSSYAPHEMRPPSSSYTPHEMMPPSSSYAPHEMRPPSSSNYAPLEMRPSSSLVPPIYLTKVYLAGLSKLPNLITK